MRSQFIFKVISGRSRWFFAAIFLSLISFSQAQNDFKALDRNSNSENTTTLRNGKKIRAEDIQQKYGAKDLYRFEGKKQKKDVSELKKQRFQETYILKNGRKSSVPEAYLENIRKNSNPAKNSKAALPYYQNFNTVDGWTFVNNGGSNLSWAIGEQTDDLFGPPSGTSGDSVAGTSLNTLYPARVNEKLVTPSLDMTGVSNPTLRFWMDMETANDIGNDGGTLQININSGGWVNVPAGAFILNAPNTAMAIFGFGAKGWSGDLPVGEWQEVVVDLTAAGVVSGDQVQMAFWFYSNTNNQGNGWYIDDFYLYDAYDMTSTIEIPATQIATQTISSIWDTYGEQVDLFSFDIIDHSTTDTMFTYPYQLVVQNNGSTADWTDHIADVIIWEYYQGFWYECDELQAFIYDDRIELVDFWAGTWPLYAEKGDTAHVTMAIYLNSSGIVDNSDLRFTIPSTGHNCEAYYFGSEFDYTFPADIISATHPIEVVATQLSWQTQPSTTATTGVPLTQQPVLWATDENGNLDVDAGGTVTLDNTGGLLMSSNTAAVVGGVATFAGFQFDSGNAYVYLFGTTGTISTIDLSVQIAVDIIPCTIFTEDFESAGAASTLPTIGWLEYDIVGSIDWGVTNTLTGFASTTPISGSYSLAMKNGALGNWCEYNKNSAATTIAYYNTLIDATTYTGLKLSFKYICDGEIGWDYIQVVWSEDGTNWNNASGSKLANENENIYQISGLDMSAANGKQFYLGFKWRNDGLMGSADGAAIDDIVLEGTPNFDYNFSYREDVFTPVVGTIVAVDAQDGANITLPAGFNFTYVGSTITDVRANINGWLEMGTSHTGDAAPSNNLLSASCQPFLAPLWDDLTADAQTRIIYATSGVSPTRVFTVEWKDVLWGGARQNFQVKLYESSDMIEFVYGTMNMPAAGMSASIGINNDNGLCINQFASVIPGTVPSISYTGENNRINSTTYLTSGMVYIFNPLEMQSYNTWQEASVCIGQATWSAQSTALDQATAAHPSSASISSKNVLAVGQQGIGLSPPMTEGRVLLWNQTPTANGTPADIVLGKTSFTDDVGGCTQSIVNSVNGVTFTPDGEKLIVSDYGNNRVLIWNTIPTANTTPADVVIGQTDFVTNTTGLSATQFDGPFDVAVFPDGRMMISDIGNNRVLIYNQVPTTNGAAADYVIGQTDFITNTAGCTQTKMSSPGGISFSPDGKLYISDTDNSRVLVYNSIPESNGAAADLVLGQSDFITGTSGLSNSKYYISVGVTVSPEGKIAVGEFLNHRVMVYNRLPTSNGSPADYTLGQPNFTENYQFNDGISNANTTNPDNRNMYTAYATRFDLNGRLLVVGRDMERTMLYGVTPTETADLDLTLTSYPTGTVCIGSEVTYTVSITNNGPDDAETVYVVASLPEGFTPVGYTASTGVYNKTTGYWMIPFIGAGQTVTLTFTGIVEPMLSGNPAVVAYAYILACSQADSDFSNNSDNVTIGVNTFYAPTISDIADQYLNTNSNTTVNFTVGDLDGIADITGAGYYTTTSSNTTLIPNGPPNLVFGGTAPNKNLYIEPAIDQYGIDTIVVTVTDSHACFVEEDFIVYVGNIWEGDISTDWHDANNWSIQVPDCSTEAIIFTNPIGGNFPVISTADATCEDLVIYSRASVTLADDVYTLTMCGDLYIYSDALGTGSLVDLTTNGQITVTGQANVQRYLTSDSWHYVSAFSPNISSTSFTTTPCGSFNGYYIQYDQSWSTDNDGSGVIDWMDGWSWPYYIGGSGNLSVANGYGYYPQSALTCSNTVEMIDPSGTLNTGTITKSVANTDDAAVNPPGNAGGGDGMKSRGWNLIGNPYPSALNITDFLASNSGTIDGSIYFWGTSGLTSLVASDYAVWNSLGSIAGTAGVVPDMYIHTGQAFIVHKTTTGSANVSFNNAMREQENSYFYKNNEEEIWKLRISASNNDNMFNEILIGFKTDATDGVDPMYDALKLPGNPDFSFYSFIDNIKYAIQGLSKFEGAGKTVKIGIYTTNIGTHEFIFQSLQYFPENMVITFEDKLTGDKVDLRQTKKYEFEVTESGQVDDRFEVHFYYNQAPIVQNPLGNIATNEDEYVEMSFTENIFTDYDFGDELSYSVTAYDGSKLPSWLYFNTNNYTLSGTPSNSDVGSYLLEVTATDSYGASVSDIFSIEVINTNDVPIVNIPLQDVSIYSGANAGFGINSQSFIDVDAGDELSYSALLDNNELPAWISFDENTLNFTASPTSENVGTYNVTVTAADILGASVTDEFVLSVLNVSGINDVNENKLTVYPNPTNGVFTIQTELADDYTVEVTDISGRLIYNSNFSSNLTEIDLTNQPTGMYLIKILSNNKVEFSSIIIDR